MSKDKKKEGWAAHAYPGAALQEEARILEGETLGKLAENYHAEDVATRIKREYAEPRPYAEPKPLAVFSPLDPNDRIKSGIPELGLTSSPDHPYEIGKRYEFHLDGYFVQATVEVVYSCEIVVTDYIFSEACTEKGNPGRLYLGRNSIEYSEKMND